MPDTYGTKGIQMITGTVKFFNADKGFGFIAPEDGSPDAFVHISAVERAGLRMLEKQQRISYDWKPIVAARPRQAISSQPDRALAKASVVFATSPAM